MWIKQLLMGIFGISSGFIVAGGVFALITAIGVLPRMAGKTHTGKHAKLYEDFVILGGTVGNILTVYKPDIPFGSVFVTMFGLFAGIFVGCLATSLAESLNTTAIFTRRINLKVGISFIVLSLALGKTIGALFHFIT